MDTGIHRRDCAPETTEQIDAYLLNEWPCGALMHAVGSLFAPLLAGYPSCATRTTVGGSVASLSKTCVKGVSMLVVGMPSSILSALMG